MQINDRDSVIFIINAYFPFKQNGDEYRIQYLDVLGGIRNIMTNNPSARFILTTDFNLNVLNDIHPMAEIVRDFLEEFDMTSTFSLDPSFDPVSTYTRSCIKRNSFSLLDFIFISRSLRDRVGGCNVDYDGRNLSDHFPVQMQLEVVPSTGDVGQSVGPHTEKSVNWSSLDDDDVSRYQSTMEHLLDSINVPYAVLHGDCYCSCDEHCTLIESYLVAATNRSSCS